MGFNDWVNRGGLFGGFGQYDRLSEESRRRANQRGLLAGGSYLLNASMQPGNFAYGGNIASALLMGRDEFDQSLERAADYERQLMLDRERRLAAFKEEQAAKADALAEYEERQAKEQAEFDKWSTSALVKNDMADYVHRKRPDLDPELLANLPDQMLKELFDEASAAPKAPKTKYEGNWQIEVDPDGNERRIRYEPSPKEGKEGKTPEEVRAAELKERDKIEARLRKLKKEDTGPDGKIIKTPRYTDEAALAAAVDAELAKRTAFIAGTPYFGNVESGASSGAAPALDESDVSDVSDKIEKYGEGEVRKALLANGLSAVMVDALIRAARNRNMKGATVANPG